MIMTLVKIQREKFLLSLKNLIWRNKSLPKVSKNSTLKVLYALVTSGKGDKLLYREENVIYGSIPNKE